MLLSNVYSKIANFITDIIDNESFTVIFANQNAPRPKKPFVTISISNIRRIGMPCNLSVDTAGVQTLMLTKLMLVTVECYTDVLHQAEETLELIENNLRTQKAYEYFEQELSYMFTVMNIMSAPSVVSSTTENRAIVQFEFLINQTLLDDLGLIEHIEITNENTNEIIIINK